MCQKMSIALARILVFARTPEHGAPPPADDLNDRISNFILSGPKCRSIDEITNGIETTGKIADFIVNDGQFIVELKSVNSNPIEKMSSVLRSSMEEEPKVVAFGRVGIQAILVERQNGSATNSKLVNVAGRSIRQQLQKANSQISETKKKFSIYEASGLVVLAVPQNSIIEASVLAHAVRHTLSSDMSQFRHIDYVWATMENHRIRAGKDVTGYPEMLMWMGDDHSRRDDAMVGSMIDAWGQFNNSAISYVKRNESWRSFDPIGDGWPLEIDVY